MDASGTCWMLSCKLVFEKHNYSRETLILLMLQCIYHGSQITENGRLELQCAMLLENKRSYYTKYKVENQEKYSIVMSYVF